MVLINAIIFFINTHACVLINQYSTGLFVSYVTHGKTQLYKNAYAECHYAEYRYAECRSVTPLF
jgi:hypothetical protein